LEHPDLTQAEDLDARLSGFTPEVVAVRLAAAHRTR
jgi:hypothetical protein